MPLLRSVGWIAVMEKRFHRPRPSRFWCVLWGRAGFYLWGLGPLRVGVMGGILLRRMEGMIRAGMCWGPDFRSACCGAFPTASRMNFSSEESQDGGLVAGGVASGWVHGIRGVEVCVG